MFKFWKIGILGLGLSLGSLGFADARQDADKLFAQRNDGSNDEERFAHSASALSAYKALYNETRDLYYFEQMGRLSVWMGGVLNNVELDKRKKVLSDCIETSEELAHHSDRQEPHYFYIGCVAAKGKISDFGERVLLGIRLRKAAPKALETTKVDGHYQGGYEGGGIHRVLGGVHSNFKAKALLLFDPEKGVEYTSIAIETPERIVRPFPNPLSGADYFENFYYNAQGTLALGVDRKNREKIEEARGTLEASINAINERAKPIDEKGTNNLPKGREPETLAYKDMMQSLLNTIDECDKSSDVFDCLYKKLTKD